MNHVETIGRLLKTVQVSERMHALLVLGPAGYGKSTAVDEALKQSGAKSVQLGTFTSPLHLFNFLYANSKAGTFVVADDTSGAFDESSAMAILKAATWAQGKPRIIRWGSTTRKAAVEEFEFRAKLIIICNSFPKSSDANAVRSRALPYQIEVGVSQAKELIKAAAGDTKWFVNTKLAQEVASLICLDLTQRSLAQISYRTLQMGYELAEHNPDDWKILLRSIISTGVEDPKKLVRRLSQEKISVKDQLYCFGRETGLKRRTFFNYRRDLNIREG